jgi:DNA-binding beta-propeller fold protein YncE
MRNIFIKLLMFYLLFALVGCASVPNQSDNASGEFVWPRPPEQARIKWLSEWYGKKDFGNSGQVMTFLIGDEKDERLRRPNGIVADLSGNIYAADSDLRIIFVFDQQKKTLRFLGFGSLAGPVGLAVDNKRGIIFVSDSRLKKVMGFSKDSDKILITVGSLGEFQSPSGMVYDNERDRLYVADTRTHMIKVFDKDGKSLFAIGKHGNADGEFNFPSYLALDKNGNLYVVDAFNFRIQIFDADGKFIKKFGKLGDGSGSFARPCGIGVDSDGNIYVADAAFNNFQIFNGDGKLLLWVGHTGKKPGGFYIPSGLFIDNKDRIYVSDTFNRRLQVFQYLSSKK